MQCGDERNGVRPACGRAPGAAIWSVAQVDGHLCMPGSRTACRTVTTHARRDSCNPLLVLIAVPLMWCLALRACVTATIDGLEFQNGIQLGELVILRSVVTAGT